MKIFSFIAEMLIEANIRKMLEAEVDSKTPLKENKSNDDVKKIDFLQNEGRRRNFSTFLKHARQQKFNFLQQFHFPL